MLRTQATLFASKLWFQFCRIEWKVLKKQKQNQVSGQWYRAAGLSKSSISPFCTVSCDLLNFNRQLIESTIFMALHKTSKCYLSNGPDVRRVDYMCTPLLPTMWIAQYIYWILNLCECWWVFGAQIACTIPNGQSGTPLQLIHWTNKIEMKTQRTGKKLNATKSTAEARSACHCSRVRWHTHTRTSFQQQQQKTTNRNSGRSSASARVYQHEIIFKLGCIFMYFSLITNEIYC